MTNQTKNECACECGSVAYQTPAKPLFRMYCHCSICQKFNDAAYGDIFVYRASDIQQPKEGLVNFDTYKAPPNVQRGKCASCAKPAIEVLNMPLLPGLIMVPGNMQAGQNDLPAPVAHVFYESRLADAQDSLPKYKGYVRSQLAFGKELLKALFRGRGQ